MNNSNLLIENPISRIGLNSPPVSPGGEYATETSFPSPVGWAAPAALPQPVSGAFRNLVCVAVEEAAVLALIPPDVALNRVADMGKFDFSVRFQSAVMHVLHAAIMAGPFSAEEKAYAKILPDEVLPANEAGFAIEAYGLLPTNNKDGDVGYDVIVRPQFGAPKRVFVMVQSDWWQMAQDTLVDYPTPGKEVTSIVRELRDGRVPRFLGFLAQKIVFTTFRRRCDLDKNAASWFDGQKHLVAQVAKTQLRVPLL